MSHTERSAAAAGEVVAEGMRRLVMGMAVQRKLGRVATGAGAWWVVTAVLMLAGITGPAAAQRPAVLDDFPGITSCEGGQAVSRIRADVRDSLLRAQLEAHEAVHRAQAAAFPSCEAFMAGLTTARRIIDVELPAYCAQWRIAVGQGAEPVETRREFAWRIAAQSGAMENRLQVVQRFEQECEPPPGQGRPPGGGNQGSDGH